jgi:ABC-type uncharacterized transport system involved in gliding motility auxiliary subunit
VIVLLEPAPLTDFGEEADPLAAYLEESWGILVGDNLVVDTSTNQPFLAYSAYYSSQHPVTSRLGTLFTAFPTARSVQAGAAPGQVELTELVYTSDQSWAETDLAALEAGEQIMPEEGIDLIGPVPLGVAAENWSSGGRVVVFGDSEFASSALFSYLGNGDLAVNAVDWVSEQEGLISLTPKAATQRILLPSTTLTQGLIALGAVFLPSGLVIAGGVAAFIARRRRG